LSGNVLDTFYKHKLLIRIFNKYFSSSKCKFSFANILCEHNFCNAKQR